MFVLTRLGLEQLLVDCYPHTSMSLKAPLFLVYFQHFSDAYVLEKLSSFVAVVVEMSVLQVQLRQIPPLILDHQSYIEMRMNNLSLLAHLAF